MAGIIEFWKTRKESNVSLYEIEKLINELADSELTIWGIERVLGLSKGRHNETTKISAEIIGDFLHIHFESGVILIENPKAILTDYETLLISSSRSRNSDFDVDLVEIRNSKLTMELLDSFREDYEIPNEWIFDSRY